MTWKLEVPTKVRDGRYYLIEYAGCPGVMLRDEGDWTESLEAFADDAIQNGLKVIGELRDGKAVSPESVKKTNCYAFLHSNGEIDLESIADSEYEVRRKMLEGSMGWRFEHPERYNQDHEWRRLLGFGGVVSVSVAVESA